MAGTTRFGYSRGGSGDDDDASPPAAPAGNATVFGRDAHLRLPVQPGLEPDPAAAPAAAPAQDPDPAAPAARMPSRSGKSGFPARAGFWGRRNTQGDLQEGHDAGNDADDAALVVPRALPPLARHALVVAASALLSFLAVLLVLELRKPPPAPASAVPTGTRELAPPLAPRPMALPTRGPAPPAARDTGVLEPMFSDRPAAKPSARPAQAPKSARTTRPARRASRPGGPGDRLLPPTFLSP